MIRSGGVFIVAARHQSHDCCGGLNRQHWQGKTQHSEHLDPHQMQCQRALPRPRMKTERCTRLWSTCSTAAGANGACSAGSRQTTPERRASRQRQMMWSCHVSSSTLLSSVARTTTRHQLPRSTQPMSGRRVRRQHCAQRNPTVSTWEPVLMHLFGRFRADGRNGHRCDVDLEAATRVRARSRSQFVWSMVSAGRCGCHLRISCWRNGQVTACWWLG